jgi:hypothetical protein
LGTVHIACALPRHPLEQKLDGAPIHPVTLHQKADKRIFYQLRKRTFRGELAHDTSPSLENQFISDKE